MPDVRIANHFSFIFVVVAEQRQLSNGKPQPVRKTSASKSPGSGILVNKSTVSTKPAPPANGSIETLNHFEKSHPKDDLEIKKQRDESTGRSANGAASKKDNKKGGNKQSKKDASPAQTVAAAERKADVVDALLSVPTETAVAVAVPVAKESPRNAPNKEKVSKKKRNEALLIQQLGKMLTQLSGHFFRQICHEIEF